MRDLACSGSRTVSLTAVGKRTTKRKATIQPSRQAPIAAAPMPAAAPYATAASATNLFLDIQSNTAGQLVTATHLQMGPADAESSGTYNSQHYPATLNPLTHHRTELIRHRRVLGSR